MDEPTYKKKRRGAWFTVKQLAGALGISEQAIRTSYLPELSVEDVRKAKGVATTIFAPAAVELFASRRVRAALQRAAVDEIERGPASEELEKLRRIKRKREELALARDVGEIESRGVVWSEIAEAMRHIRRFAEEQIREHGNGTADAWSEVVAEVNRIAVRYAPSRAKSRTLHVQLVDGTSLEIPLSIDEVFANEKNKAT